MKRIVLYTATGAQNLGDECILLAEYRFLRARYPDADLRIATYDPGAQLLPTDNKVTFFSYFPNGFGKNIFANIGYFFRNCYEIARADLVIVGGGGLFYDNEAGQSWKKQLLEWKLRIVAAKFFRTIVFFWGIGIDVSRENRAAFARLFAGKRTVVSVRDRESEKFIESIGQEVHRVRDPVFTLEYPESIRHKTRPKVGLALRAGYMPNEPENIEKIIRFLQSEGFEPVFLTHSFHPTNALTNDAVSFARIADELQVHTTQTMDETFALYRDLTFVISMRLHASILSVVAGIPFYAISYAKKTDEILRDVGTSYVQRASTFDPEIFKTQFRELIQTRETQQFALIHKYDTIKANTLESYNFLFDGLQILHRKNHGSQL